MAPDLGMIGFHLADHPIHHHRFWPHIPAVWAVIAAITLPLIARFRPSLFNPAMVFFLAILIHLILDTVGGGIMWLWPFSDRLTELVTVPATQSHWILSFMLHRTFLPELMICAVALIIFLRPRNRPH